MKYLIILGDGMADEPIPALGGKTPLAYATIPNMDRVAREGRMGLLATVPDGYEPGSDIANLSVLGCDPRTCYTGRGPLEAISMDVAIPPGAAAYRCNLVTTENGIMADFSAGHITSEEGADLFATLNEALGDDAVFYPGISYRHLLILHDAGGAVTTPPHDIVDEPVAAYLPNGDDADRLRALMATAEEVFAGHPVNVARLAAGKPPATGIWPWSGGKQPALPNFTETYGLKGGMISAVDLLNGIAIGMGMDVITVPGATGYLDTDYMAKARAAAQALETLDFVYMHVEAPDEAGHLGSPEEKIKAIEHLDEAVGYLLEHVDGIIALLPDHPTPCQLKTHTSDPVPFAIRGLGTDETTVYTEEEAINGSFGLMVGTELLPLMLGN